MRLLIKGGRVVDPLLESDGIYDILIKDGYIEKVADEVFQEPDMKVFDAEGCIVVPGLFDMHVHLREPGFEASEDIESGTLAARRGGFIGVACMPNTDPAADNAAVITFILNKAQQQGSCRVLPIGSITKGSRGEELSEIADMQRSGITAISDDGNPVPNAAVMRNAMLYAKSLGLPIVSHCEEKSLSSGGAVHEGYTSTVLGLKGIPSAAEEVAVFRDVKLAENTGAALHIAHVSTLGSVEIVRTAKEKGVNVTCEAAPHHFSLTDACVKGYDTNTKVNPPLRSQEDIDAIISGLKDGTIDVIATDHAPHAHELKRVEYDYAPFGISGLETALPLVVTRLVLPGHLSWKDAVAKFTVGPLKVLGDAPLYGIKEAVPASITVIDPRMEKPVDVEQFRSKGRNSPFASMKLKGWPIMSLYGDCYYENEKEQLIELGGLK